MGLVGIFTSSKGFLGFFGFLYYTRYFFVIPDELFKANLQKAATPAFFVGIAITSVTIVMRKLTDNKDLVPIGMGIGMAVSLFVFSIILLTFEARENGEKNSDHKN